jgi:hypothetical protein
MARPASAVVAQDIKCVNGFPLPKDSVQPPATLPIPRFNPTVQTNVPGPLFTKALNFNPSTPQCKKVGAELNLMAYRFQSPPPPPNNSPENSLRLLTAFLLYFLFFLILLFPRFSTVSTFQSWDHQ